ncbi:MAG TPA: HAMP domain-containing sensor histidine kinase [Telluria sp.]|nr:HAMP domain-containing sensor histidine kinase [Telluria sp.]
MRSAAPRLYLRIFLTLLASLVAAAALFGAVHLWFSPGERQAAEAMAQVAAQALPPATAAPEEQRAALQRWRQRTRGPLALYSADRQLLASVGRPLPPLDARQSETGPMRGSRAVYALRLDDGRWLLIRRPQSRRLPSALFPVLLLTALIVAVAAYPVVRRITARLERLQGSVQSWGRGDLSARVAVEGNDEVASLATSFNEAADHIEALVGSQKTLLANASHELRSPLARIRMAVELMHDGAAPALREELVRNIGELDQLIDEVLLASRLDAPAGEALMQETLDLGTIVADECARAGANLEAEPAMVRGDPRLLRRMVRNLLENAQRYGEGTPVTVTLGAAGGRVLLDVCDRGPGVPEEEREHIFTAFYRLPGASEREGGVGLGLALVRQIAQRHGGDAHCLGRDGGGSCFRVTMPSA